MSNCCDNSCTCRVFHFGDFACGGCIELPLVAVQAGLHQIKADWRGRIWSVQAVFDVGDPIKFNNIFNEDAVIEFEIIQPDGCPISYNLLNCDGDIIQTICRFSVRIAEIFTYEDELITAQEVCGSELAEDGSIINVCQTF